MVWQSVEEKGAEGGCELETAAKWRAATMVVGMNVRNLSSATHCELVKVRKRVRGLGE